MFDLTILIFYVHIFILSPIFPLFKTLNPFTFAYTCRLFNTRLSSKLTPALVYRFGFSSLSMSKRVLVKCFNEIDR